MRIALVTDSTCDIPHELVSAYNIHVVPNILIIDGKSIEDDEHFSRQDFYKQLPQLHSFPTTSTASVGTYQKLYEQILISGYDQILSIHCSSKLSAIYSAATTAANSVQGQIEIVDSRQISLGLGFQVLEAADAILKGLPLDAILGLLGKMRKELHVIAMLDTLEYVRRSGRVSWARARLGAILNYKPFLEVIDGDVLSLGEVRTRKKGIARLMEMVRSEPSLIRFGVLHTDAEDDARLMLDNLGLELPTEPLVVNVTTAIGAHVGPNGLGFASYYQAELEP